MCTIVESLFSKYNKYNDDASRRLCWQLASLLGESQIEPVSSTGCGQRGRTGLAGQRVSDRMSSTRYVFLSSVKPHPHLEGSGVS